MKKLRVWGMLLVAGAGGAVLLTPAAQAAAVPKTSAIFSKALNVCLDPSFRPDPYDTLAGARCSGSAAQTFSFIPITGGSAHTYLIKDKRSGKCINQFRQGIEAGSCGTAWTLRLVAGTTNVYRMAYSGGYWGVTTVGGGAPHTLFSYGINPQPHENFTIVAGL